MPTSEELWTWQCENIFPSDMRTGRRILEEVLRELELQHWNNRDIFCVHLAVYEALINAVVHGNREDLGKTVHFVCRLSPRRVHVEITDEGPGFAPDLLPDPTDDAFLDKPGGRGVLLMRAFMSRVSFNPTGNHVILERDRSDAPREKIVGSI
ncbi:MAG: ATP-binding protein [Thermoguttaceae bacterium]